MKYAAYLDHSDWMAPEFFLGNTVIEAEKAAMAALLAHTDEYRDEDKFPNDEDWIDECFNNEWTLAAGEIKNA